MKKLALSAVLAASFAFGVDYDGLSDQCIQGGLGLLSGDKAACNRLENLCVKKDGKACFYVGTIVEAALKVLEMSKKDQENGILLMLDSYQKGCKYGYQPSCDHLRDLQK